MSTLPFSVLVAVAAAAIILAVFSQKLSRWLRVPAPVFFLAAAAVAALALPPVSEAGRSLDDRIVSIALVFILFDGGMKIGWRRFRASAAPIVWLGVVGTLVTAAAIVLVAHFLLGLDWRLALLVGAALSPTDPAAVFSVLGQREITGRVGTMLEGESGANDPVGIAIVTSLLAASGGGMQAIGTGVLTFGLQLVVGAAVGIVGGLVLREVLQRFVLPSESLASVLAIASAAFLYGAADLAHGSGFLAVLVAGIAIGDARAPYKTDIVGFASGVSSLAEITAFVMLGLTIRLQTVFRPDVLIGGIVLAALLVFVIRPVLVGAVSLPIRLTGGERLFLLWSGLRGAVPILLGLTILSAGVPGASGVYAMIFVVVFVSVLLQGSLVPLFARIGKVAMREVEPRPFALDIRFAHPPTNMHRLIVDEGSDADGATVASLQTGGTAWLSMASRDGRNLPLHAEAALQAGDIVMIQSPDDDAFLDRFTVPPDDESD
ncbi:cation:proton antiporter domain-containing protein [Curtobacterium ammoniigenes]|uniref:cation:proton antiporter domain-containing protein n=1 Tax=Curtobacterium ammoniigenes TaxID=395387 RepID=UPI00082EBAA7|nr:cation:proton antiporter [Curtobacterium ammoniigenes]